MTAVEIKESGGTAYASSSPSTVAVTTGIATGKPYAGSYEVTPSPEAQVLPTALCMLAQDITVNPIPSNYGLVEWNGSSLTVS